jgi:hypothetical protein
LFAGEAPVGDSQSADIIDCLGSTEIARQLDTPERREFFLIVLVVIVVLVLPGKESNRARVG